MKHIILLFIFIVCFSDILNSQSLQVSLDEIQTATKSYLATSHHKELFSISQVNTLIGKNGDTILFEITTDKGRSLLFSGHKACIPLLGDYISNNKSIVVGLVQNALPCNIHEYMNVYIEQIEAAFEDKDTTQHHREEWNKLLGHSGHDSSIQRYGVNPLLSTKWGQDSSNYDATRKSRS